MQWRIVGWALPCMQLEPLIILSTLDCSLSRVSCEQVGCGQNKNNHAVSVFERILKRLGHIHTPHHTTRVQFMVLYGLWSPDTTVQPWSPHLIPTALLRFVLEAPLSPPLQVLSNTAFTTFTSSCHSLICQQESLVGTPDNLSTTSEAHFLF